MANNFNTPIPDFEYMLNQLLTSLNNLDLDQSSPVRSNLSSVIPTQNSNLVSLKTKIDHFFQQHSDIVNEIKSHFYDDLIMYTVKQTFDPSFTINDVTQTHQLLNRFFIEYEDKNKIIFDYFFDDLKPLILNSFPRLNQFNQLIDSIPKSVLRELIIGYLKRSGASHLTSYMYPNQKDLIQNLSKQSTLHEHKYFFLLSFFIMLCIIFGSEIFRFILYYFIGLICTVFTLYLLVDF
jgi:hypothetical protein